MTGGVGVSVSFVYKYTLLIQEYRNSSRVIAFLRPIIPSLLATVGGILTTIVSCKSINGNPKKEESPQENTPASPGGDVTESLTEPRSLPQDDDVSHVSGRSTESAVINNETSVEVHD